MHPVFCLDTPTGMNLEKIIAELRNEVESIEDAIAALQKLLPNPPGPPPAKPPASK
jgi:hypothetical protein